MFACNSKAGSMCTCIGGDGNASSNPRVHNSLGSNFHIGASRVGHVKGEGGRMVN